MLDLITSLFKFEPLIFGCLLPSRNTLNKQIDKSELRPLSLKFYEIGRGGIFINRINAVSILCSGSAMSDASRLT